MDVLSVKGFSFFGMVPTFYNQKKPTLTARGEQLDAIRVASQGQNIVIPTATVVCTGIGVQCQTYF